LGFGSSQRVAKSSMGRMSIRYGNEVNALDRSLVSVADVKNSVSSDLMAYGIKAISDEFGSKVAKLIKGDADKDPAGAARAMSYLALSHPPIRKALAKTGLHPDGYAVLVSPGMRSGSTSSTALGQLLNVYA